MPYNTLAMVFIETSVFTRLVKQYLTDDDYVGLQNHLLLRPDAGPIIRGTGGVRKLRWRTSTTGKRGGIRIIYYWHVNDDEIWLLTIYGKSERDSIPAHVLKQIVNEMKNV
jgi:mRNA-degrading endonuclease RelE of RelBE toxin-antitoxin system